MLEGFYHLTGAPFQLTPDNRFFFESRVHARAIAHLQFGLAQGEGFVVITGEVGAGKTTLVERLWEQLDRSAFVIARISTTQLAGDDLLRMALAGFGVAGAEDGADKSALLLRFQQMLREHHDAGRRCLLVVDEVQNLTLPALEELRMLSNLSEAGQAVLQTILVGQPQFRAMLASPELAQLAQRVLSSYHLGALSAADTRAYIEHRLSTVGWEASNPRWDDAAFASVWRHTGGIPRRINRLCGRVLMYGALEETRHITAAMVDATARELDSDMTNGVAAAPPLEAMREIVVPAAAPPAPASPSPDARAAMHSMAETLRQELRDDDLRQRVELLEMQMARREKLLQRLLDALGRLA